MCITHARAFSYQAHEDIAIVIQSRELKGGQFACPVHAIQCPNQPTNRSRSFFRPNAPGCPETASLIKQSVKVWRAVHFCATLVTPTVHNKPSLFQFHREVLLPLSPPLQQNSSTFSPLKVNPGWGTVRTVALEIKILSLSFLVNPSKTYIHLYVFNTLFTRFSKKEMRSHENFVIQLSSN